MAKNRLAENHFPVEPEDVNTYLGASLPAAQVQAHINVASDMVEGYTRGEGFNDLGFPVGDVRQVILGVTVRSLTNPQSLQRQAAGSQSVTYGRFEGFTLAEQRILNRYRQMAS